ncbi:uncharacterized protein CELE_F56D6.13 [Caenorhabditis elegans]|uniref:Uncharacterized protein n=1 Tax=Caenorhabditis elegans TaxID=6239 RepID=Q4R113_CAEEL|nr:Uncharacterized protein CELE_F56D6.13 [Caenorhabditis elegans]CCD70730.1 Uncharacterized protein CELE_F56D6.13 [Caenorhabditis elegans]|eukprot:NP_001033415.1 Uncharacterized protein CELE_F56D6.13 [Caenorhabditis elegans]
MFITRGLILISLLFVFVLMDEEFDKKVAKMNNDHDKKVAKNNEAYDKAVAEQKSMWDKFLAYGTAVVVVVFVVPILISIAASVITCILVRRCNRNRYGGPGGPTQGGTTGGGF